jgi:hypothetical protein
MIASLTSFDKKVSEFYDREQIRKEIKPKNTKEAIRSRNYTPPSTPTQEKIAKIWSELLGREQISVDDELFGLGGNSIIALQILAQIYQSFQIGLGIDIIFSASFTIEQISQLVDDKLIAQVDQDELTAILNELDGLSDDEVRALM